MSFECRTGILTLRAGASATAGGLIIWWVAIAMVRALIALALVDVTYWHVVYLFVVMLLAGVWLLPVAYLANRRLRPWFKAWTRR